MSIVFGLGGYAVQKLLIRSGAQIRWRGRTWVSKLDVSMASRPRCPIARPAGGRVTFPYSSLLPVELQMPRI